MPDKNFALDVRVGTPADYPAVLDIQRRAYTLKEVPLYGPDLVPLKETPETLAAEITEGYRLLVGEHQGRIVASLRMSVQEDGAVYFGRLSVDPDFQGRGIGQRMVLAVEEAEPKASDFVLSCGEHSEENHHIYSKLGYRDTDETFQVPGGPRVRVMRKRKEGV